MKITRVVWHESGDTEFCPNRVTCEATYRTDQGGVIRVLKPHRRVSRRQMTKLGVRLARGEFAVFTPDEMEGSA